mgnify:CR=1 FL=1
MRNTNSNSDSLTLNYAVVAIFDLEAVKLGFGRWDSKGRLRLSFAELGYLNQLIRERKFPKEYYLLCDKLDMCYESY